GAGNSGPDATDGAAVHTIGQVWYSGRSRGSRVVSGISSLGLCLRRRDPCYGRILRVAPSAEFEADSEPFQRSPSGAQLALEPGTLAARALAEAVRTPTAAVITHHRSRVQHPPLSTEHPLRHNCCALITIPPCGDYLRGRQVSECGRQADREGVVMKNRAF